MSEGKRPGGLTALAVLNFVFGGFGVIAILALWALYSLVTGAAKVAAGQGTAGAQDIAAVTQVGGTMVLISLVLLLVSVTLLIVSGVGYLGQKKFLGQRLGSIYGIVSVVQTVISIAFLKSGFGIGTIIGLIYPVLTLILLNNTFKDDFVNP